MINFLKNLFLRACPFVPSAFGSLNATSDDVGAEVGELSETTLPPECFSEILDITSLPP